MAVVAGDRGGIEMVPYPIAEVARLQYRARLQPSSDKRQSESRTGAAPGAA